MDITIEWDNPEHTIIRYTFASHWTIEEFFEAFPVADHMIRLSTTRVIGIIIDDSREIVPPKGAMNAYKQTVRSGKLPIVFVGASMASRSMMEILHKAYHSQRPMYYVSTLDEARRVLYEYEAQHQMSEHKSQG
jgi:hypothetical protein